MMLRIATIILCINAAPALADVQISTAGVTYRANCNAHGAILRDVSEATPPIILGASCDASVPDVGTGTWGATKNGFIVDLEIQRFVFPGQAYPCGTMADPDPYFGLSCYAQ